jgi:hypothetical protein
MSAWSRRPRPSPAWLTKSATAPCNCAWCRSAKPSTASIAWCATSASELGKDIDLVITGAETELDKTVVEKIGDPLMHLVRNAIDHGIEPRRRAPPRAKPARGTVRLNAFHDSGSIVIEVADDGGGLDTATHPRQGRWKGPGQTGGADPVRAGNLQAHLRARLLHRRPGHQPVRARRRHGRGAAQHRSPARHVHIDSQPGVGTTCASACR